MISFSKLLTENDTLDKIDKALHAADYYGQKGVGPEIARHVLGTTFEHPLATPVLTAAGGAGATLLASHLLKRKKEAKQK